MTFFGCSCFYNKEKIHRICIKLVKKGKNQKNALDNLKSFYYTILVCIRLHIHFIKYTGGE